MSKLEKFKEALRLIDCNFVSQPTLIGTTILIYNETSIIHFEFDLNENFLRTITEQNGKK